MDNNSTASTGRPRNESRDGLAVSDELRTEIDRMARETAPRRFAICAANEAEQDGAVLAWGQYFGEGDIVLTDEGGMHARISSMRTALRMCRCPFPLHVTWIDPEPEGVRRT